MSIPRGPLRVLALMDETLVPPEEITDEDVATVPWKTEFDVATTLRDLGHEVTALGVSTDLGPIRDTLAD